MSKSRLEKFLYALYSLDSSDLPNPLSRIEELYKCLVTGDEAPTFEPLSRVEKYLMAILGSYDAELLPNPLSRVEVLLYKLATGNDNLDDFKSFLSEHEELLAEIIRNGGVGGNIDIEYVLYSLSTEHNTLYNTAEKPIKSAILKGNTIVSHYSSDIIELTANGSWVENPVLLTQITLPVKPSTDYLFVVEIIENSLIGDETINNSLRFGETEGTGRFPTVFKSISAIPLHQLGMYRFILTTKADISNIDIFDRKQLSKHCTGGKIKFRYVVIEYQQGMENWDIPYFEGMQSVKMPVLTTVGKNLNTGTLVLGKIENNGKVNELVSSMCYNPDYIEVMSNTEYGIRWIQEVNNMRVFFYDCKRQFIGKGDLIIPSGGTFITPSNCKYIRFHLSVAHDGWQNYEVAIHKGNIVPTSYEPYKTNILSMEKNLFDGILTPDYLTDSTGQPSGLNNSLKNSCYTPSYIPIQANEKFRLRVTSDGSTTVGDGRVYFYDKDYNYLKIYVTSLPVYTNTFSMDVINTVPNNSNIAYMRVRFFNGLGVQADSVQINKVYELCGIGDVKDELDLITGELTQRIGECSLDGSSNSGKWVIRTDVYTEGYIYFQQELNYILQSENIAICDRLPYSNQSHISSEQLRLSAYNNGTRIGVRLSESKGVSSLDEFSEYLKSNPIKFKYPLATASIKTVDLSVVDQDGNNTEISTFNDITHVTLSSEGLIPEAELEVATKNEEVLNTMSLEMDDISTTQNALQETSNTQSENVDATMLATTEIYEGLL